MTGYFYIAGTVLLTVYGQLALRWRVAASGAMLTFVGHLLVDPWVISGLFAAFLAFLCWIGALSHFDLTYAYPFTSLAFILVLVLGVLVFHEPVTLGKVVGVLLVCCGLVVAARWG
jgi:multidrug transporter EmrE-like cation transporter